MKAASVPVETPLRCELYDSCKRFEENNSAEFIDVINCKSDLTSEELHDDTGVM